MDSDSDVSMNVLSEEEEEFVCSDADDDDFEFDDEENVPPPKKAAPKAKVTKAKVTTGKRGGAGGGKKAKKAAPAPKKKVSADVGDVSSDEEGKEGDDDAANQSVLSESNRNANAVPAPAAAKGKKKTVEEMYQKKTQLEHILLRPDTYIGSVVPITDNMYVLQQPSSEDGSPSIVPRDITYTPGLYKIFDEIVVNAADNKQRDPMGMDKMEISVDAEANLITVKNNGKGIPVVMHKEHKVYVPTLIFGHLLTGSNFDDDEKKTTGGRNGYGAKLANVFSTRFEVECYDSEQNLKFHQVFRNNMSVVEKPTVKKCSSAEKKRAGGDYVKISFSPDLQRFGMSSLDHDTVALLSKRAYDVAGALASRGGKKLVVSLNGHKLPIKNFKDYLSLIAGVEKPVAYEKDDRWEVGVAPSTDGVLRQISFVNSINTSKGGQHVSYLADQIGNHLVKVVKKKNKSGTVVKPAQIKNHLFIFANCLIENPAFDSQTKETLTTRPKAFGSEFKLSDAFLKKVEKSDIVNNIVSFVNFRAREALKRKGGTKKTKLTGIVKLDDANFAGTAKSKDCTLIITEGDSAKSLAMSGLSVVGRDYYGVFPLRGKPLNVRDSNNSKVINNEEIKNLVDIMGLKFQTVYNEDNIKTLRYGHLMIMADQDVDGSHIKGLVINFIHHFWPSLLDVPGFLQQFITPIVKVSKGKKSHTFFNIPEYEQWLESTGNHGKGFKIKYYKGLGTSTSAEAKEYFSQLDTHEVHFGRLCNDKGYNSDDDDDLAAVLPDRVTSGSDLIDMVFRKTRVEDRKEWLNNIAKDTYLDYSQTSSDGVRYSDFINKDYILFSKYDNERSIPHVIDGFKPSQRKILFACFKRKLKGEIKVAQLVGYVAEHSAYHHGEQSLQGAIVNMAQNFVGSNNLNLLTPSGQFGTRRMGGKDAASARYIFTKLEKITRAIFHPDDDELLTYLKDDGATIEPEFYMPVIPMVLVNGAEGIGTGWSSTVPNYSPRDIIDNLRRKIQGEEMEAMFPHYHGFTGEIVKEAGKKSFIVKGKIEKIDDTTLLISELPIKKWTQDYKQFLETMLNGDAKKPAEIKDFLENHTDSTVAFKVIAEKEKIDAFEKFKGGLYGKFKLTTTLSTANMNLFDQEGRITKYETPEAILSAFYDLRLDYYSKRKELLVEKLGKEQSMLSNKARFVEEVCAGELIVSNRKRAELLRDLVDRGYDTFGKDKKKENVEGDESSDEENEEAEKEDTSSDAELAKGYDYLLGMKIWTLTYEKAEELRRQLEEKTKALEDLQATSPTDIWLTDLDEIDKLLDERDDEMEKAEADEKRAQKKNEKRQKKITKKKAAARGKKGKKKKDEWDSDMASSSSEEEAEESDDDVFRVAKKPAARPRGRAAAKKTTNIEKLDKTETVDQGSKRASDGSDGLSKRTSDGSDGLVEKFKKVAVSPQPKKKGRGKKNSVDSNASEKEQKNAQQKKAAKKRPSPRGESGTDSDKNGFSGDEEQDVAQNKRTCNEPTPVAIKKKVGKAQAKRGGAAASRKAAAKKDESESEDEFELMSEDEVMSEGSDSPPAAKSPPLKLSRAPRRGVRNAKPVSYVLSDDDDESDDESDFE